MQAKWICCQLGAREHYAIPRALQGLNRLELLFTDVWVEPNSPFAKISTSLGQRFHPDLATAEVFAPTVQSIISELQTKLTSIGNRASGSRYWQGRYVRNASFQSSAVARLSRVPKDGKPRVVMAYSYMALRIFELARARGWKTVLGQIDPGPPEERIVTRLYEDNSSIGGKPEIAPPAYWDDWRQECALADRVVVNSAWTRTALEGEGVPPGKIKIVPLAYDDRNGRSTFVRHYPTHFTSNRPLRVLFLGQIIYRKGLKPLLDAISLLRGYPIEFCFVGPVQVFIPDDMRNNTHVRWIGPVSRKDTAKYYRDADVFIFPTFSDGFGLTQLEAQSWRLPVIASKTCGEVVEHDVNGWLLPEVSAKAIFDVLIFCVDNPKRLCHLSNRAVLSDRFSVAEVGRQWLHVFDGLSSTDCHKHQI